MSKYTCRSWSTCQSQGESAGMYVPNRLGCPAVGMPGAPEAFFGALPPSKTLTLGMDVPEGWLVEPIAAVHDLDNIRLEDVGDPNGLRADFELEALLLSGSCIDTAARRQDEVTATSNSIRLTAPAFP